MSSQDPESTPPLSPSHSPDPPLSTASSSSLSLPLSNLSLSSEDSDRRLSHHSRFGKGKLGLTQEQADEDALMLDDYEWEEAGEDGLGYSNQPRPQTATNDPRPFLVHRQSSYSKRHASVDTPREVPFPYPFLSSPPRPSPTSPDDSSRHLQSAPGLRLRSSSQPPSDIIDASLADQDHPPAYENLDGDRAQSGPAALPHTPSSVRPSRPLPSFTSRPLIMPSTDPSINHQPFSPPAGARGDGSSQQAASRDASGNELHSPPGSDLSYSATASSSSVTLVHPNGRPFSSPATQSTPVIPPGRFQPANTSASNWYDRSSTASLPLPSHQPLHTLPSIRSHPPESIPESQYPAGPSTPPRPRPPETTSSNVSTISNPPPPYSPHPPPPPLPAGVGMSRSASDRFATYTHVRAPTSAPPPPVQTTRSLPPPAPPTIMAPPASPPGRDPSMRAPHEPFLADAPPPPDSWIAVETFPREYNLVVRLPGFRRDAITLATRRRRVLHLVADSWEAGGGHFERRISFGYDADLSQVRAEFDGELLRVIIPRRIPVMTWYGEARE